jgi:photosystem II stability/assembly factor-like uncharacterized protein
MRALLQTLFFFLLVTKICFSQQNFWKQTAEPPEGFYLNHPVMNGAGDIFCAYHYVHRSTDHGLSWKELKTGLGADSRFISIAINRKGYIFTGHWGDGWGGNGVFRSTDNGENWTRTTFPYVCPIKMAIDSSGGLLVATSWDQVGIVRSTDDGETWSVIGPNTGTNMKSIAVNAEGHIFAGTEIGFYRSTNLGLSWTFTGIDFDVQGIAFSSNGNVFITRGYSYGYPSIYTSTDNGNSWDSIPTFPQIPHEGGTFSGIAIDTADNIFVAGDRSYSNMSPGNYRSTDLGLTWTRIPAMNSSGFQDALSLSFCQMGHLLIGTTDYGIAHSTDMGENWDLTGHALSHVKCLSIAEDEKLIAGLQLYAGRLNGGVFFSETDGNSWKFGGLNDKNIQCVLGTGSTSILVGTDNGIYSTTDDGTNWTISGLPNTSVLCMDRSLGGSIFVGTVSSGIYRSTDNGTSWSLVGLLNKNILSLLSDDSQTIFVGTESAGVYRSIDNGISWSFLGLPNTTITSLSRFGVDIIAGTNSGVYKSPDNGTTWFYVGHNDRSIQDILITSGNGIYAATSDSGVYYSVNEGQTWTRLKSGLNHLNVTSLAIDNDGYLYVGTDGGGVYKSTETVVGLNEENVLQPSSFQLLQNYPNPFNPTTSIQYSVSSSQFVELRVYDVLGNEIATLVNEEKEAGYHTIDFNGSDLPSGVYFYRMQAGNFIETKKMILLK